MCSSDADLFRKVLAALVNFMMSQIGYSKENNCYLNFEKVHFSLYAGKMMFKGLTYADKVFSDNRHVRIITVRPKSFYEDDIVSSIC